jgi:hypothetical protein
MYGCIVKSIEITFGINDDLWLLTCRPRIEVDKAFTVANSPFKDRKIATDRYRVK